MTRYGGKLWLFVCIWCIVGLLSAQATAFITETTNSDVDENAIQTSAQPLLARGARVAVYMVQTGDADDFLVRLRQDGLADGGGVVADVIALYIALDTRYSEIRWGANYEAWLNDTTIRREVMNPQLRDGLYTSAFSETLEAIEATLAQAPSSGTAPTTEVPVPVWVIGLIVAIGCIPLLLIYGVATGKIQSTGTNSTNTSDTSWTSSSVSSSDWSSSSSSDSSSGGSDGGSWSD